jgi:very-short-patch-repair endonuclease
LPVDQIVRFRGVPVTTPALTMVHLAAVCHPERVGRALDRAWSEGLLDASTMYRLLDRIGARGRNGVGVMRRLMEHRGPSYTPPASNLESRFMQIIDVAPGLPSMRRQVELGGERWLGRVDFVWDDIPGLVEIQSERYHTAMVDRDADAARLRALEKAGFSVLEVWDDDIFHRPWVVIEQVRTFRSGLEQARFGAQNA